MKRWLPFWGFKFHLQTLCWSVYQDAGGRDFLFVLFVLRQHRLFFLKSDWSYSRKLNNLKHFQEYTRVVLDGSQKKASSEMNLNRKTTTTTTEDDLITMKKKRSFSFLNACWSKVTALSFRFNAPRPTEQCCVYPQDTQHSAKRRSFPSRN